MSRNGLLIVAAVILALGAAAVFLGSNYLGTNLFGPTSLEDRFANDMQKITSEGGFAATFTDADSRRWQLADGHKFERLALDSSNAALGRLSSSVPVDATPPSWESQGLSIELPISFAQQSNGKRIEIGIAARSARSNPSNVLTAVFATRQAGNSGWRNFKLSSELKIHTILFDMPFVESGYTSKPIVVLHSDAAGRGRAVEIVGLYVKLVPRAQP